MPQHLKAIDARELHNMRTGSRWRRISARQLRDFPLCEWCRKRGITKAAEVAHHETPHHGDRLLMYTSKLISLCKTPCHDSVAKTIEQRGYDTAIGADGYPLDVEHHPFFKQGR